MFSQLLASRPVRERATGGFGASVAFHGLLVAGALSVGVTANSVVSPPLVVPIRYMPAPAQPVRSSPPRVPVAPQANAAPGVIAVPIDVPALLPIVDPTRSLGEVPPFTRIGAPTIGMPATSPVPEGAPYRADEVEVTVEIAKGSPLPRFPSAMSFARIQGSTRFQFVVDTLGHVELETVRELESTNEAFSIAVRSTLPRMRFTPARAGGRAVRQLVEFPTVFRLER